VWVATLARARRTNEFSRSSYNRFNEVEDNQVLAGPPLQELAARRGEQEAFTYSLHDQPSF
jgi:hypothetical protein